VDRDGKTESMSQTYSNSVKTGGIGPVGGYGNNVQCSETKSVLESSLGAAHMSAVKYVKDKKISTGFSPSQLNAKRQQKTLSYVSFASGIAGTGDALTGGKVLGATASKALGVAALFPTLVDLANDYSGRADVISYKTSFK